jgi:iron complex transport system substrate-binding protein
MSLAKNIVLFLIGVSIVVLSACRNQDRNQQKETAISAKTELEMSYSSLLTLSEWEGGYSIEIANPWKENDVIASYLLYRGDIKAAKQVNPSYDSYIQIPIDQAALHSVSDIGYFSQLDLLNVIAGLADVNWAYNPAVLAAIENKCVEDIGPSADVNFEILQKLQADVYIRPAYEKDQAWKSDPHTQTIPTFLNLDWRERHPLGRAEWIKVFGMLTDQLNKADSLYQETMNSYLAISKKVTNLSQKPDVLIGANYKGIWYLPSGGSYKSILLEDAGADYHWKNEKQSGSLSLNFENVLQAQGAAPVWIEAPVQTKEALKAIDDRYALFDAYKTDNVFHNLKRSTPAGGNDYWETGVSKPSLILHDLVNILHPGILEDQNLYFYQRLDEQE